MLTGPRNTSTSVSNPQPVPLSRLTLIWASRLTGSNKPQNNSMYLLLLRLAPCPEVSSNKKDGPLSLCGDSSQSAPTPTPTPPHPPPHPPHTCGPFNSLTCIVVGCCVNTTIALLSTRRLPKWSDNHRFACSLSLTPRFACPPTQRQRDFLAVLSVCEVKP